VDWQNIAKVCALEQCFCSISQFWKLTFPILWRTPVHLHNISQLKTYNHLNLVWACASYSLGGPCPLWKMKPEWNTREVENATIKCTQHFVKIYNANQNAKWESTDWNRATIIKVWTTLGPIVQLTPWSLDEIGTLESFRLTLSSFIEVAWVVTKVHFCLRGPRSFTHISLVYLIIPSRQDIETCSPICNTFQGQTQKYSNPIGVYWIFNQ